MNPFKLIYRIYNPNAVTDKNGKVIDDIRRRRNSKHTRKMIESGAIKLGQIDYTTGARKIRIGARGNVNLKGDAK